MSSPAAQRFFAGITAVLAKEGIRTTDSTVATALRTIVVLAGAWGMVLIVGSQTELAHLDARSTGLLVLSGLATGASWLGYFKALQLGSVSKVVPIDKLSTVLTVLLGPHLPGGEGEPHRCARSGSDRCRDVVDARRR